MKRLLIVSLGLFLFAIPSRAQSVDAAAAAERVPAGADAAGVSLPVVPAVSAGGCDAVHRAVQFAPGGYG